jgi:SAM-dependent methyltransferase
MRSLVGWLRDPLLDGIDVDSADRLTVHRRMLARKPMLRAVFQSVHRDFRRLDERIFSGEGVRIEIGAGVAPMRDSYPDVIATDVFASPQLDRILDAQSMDLPNASVRCFYAQNSFHHLSDPDRFFCELNRTLIPGGGAILLEPYYGALASFLYPRLFRTEGFDKQAQSWTTPVTGPMSGVNQALSYLVFVRDRKLFEKKHPQLEVIHREVFNKHIEYLLSGGLNFRQLLPGWAAPVAKLTALLLSPFNRWLALHHIVVIRRKTVA